MHFVKVFHIARVSSLARSSTKIDEMIFAFAMMDFMFKLIIESLIEYIFMKFWSTTSQSVVGNAEIGRTT